MTSPNHKALRDALAADGLTDGPWISAGPSFGGGFPVYCNEVVVDCDGDEDDTYTICVAPLGLDDQVTPDMDYIAAANPATIRPLLDELDASRAALSIVDRLMPLIASAAEHGQHETAAALIRQMGDERALIEKHKDCT